VSVQSQSVSIMLPPRTAWEEWPNRIRNYAVVDVVVVEFGVVVVWNSRDNQIVYG
jgi:uncharacterized Rmd1/YagE family protein